MTVPQKTRDSECEERDRERMRGDETENKFIGKKCMISFAHKDSVVRLLFIDILMKRLNGSTLFSNDMSMFYWSNSIIIKLV